MPIHTQNGTQYSAAKSDFVTEILILYNESTFSSIVKTAKFSCVFRSGILFILILRLAKVSPSFQFFCIHVAEVRSASARRTQRIVL